MINGVLILLLPWSLTVYMAVIRIHLSIWLVLRYLGQEMKNSIDRLERTAFFKALPYMST